MSSDELVEAPKPKQRVVRVIICKVCLSIQKYVEGETLRCPCCSHKLEPFHWSA